MHSHHKVLPLIKNLNDTIIKLGNNSLKEYDLTLGQCHIIAILSQKENNEAPLKEIEKYLNIAQSTTLGIVSRLESKGFITTKQDINDKRIKIICLTDESRVLANTITKSTADLEEQLLSNLTEIEQSIFLSLLQKIIANK